MPEDSASGAIRAITARSRDVLDAVATVASLRANLDCAEVADELAIRLEFGVPAEMVAVAGTYGTGLTRGDYLELHRTGLRDADSIEETSDDDLADLLGKVAAERVRTGIS